MATLSGTNLITTLSSYGMASGTVLGGLMGMKLGNEKEVRIEKDVRSPTAVLVTKIFLAITGAMIGGFIGGLSGAPGMICTAIIGACSLADSADASAGLMTMCISVAGLALSFFSKHVVTFKDLPFVMFPIFMDPLFI